MHMSSARWRIHAGILLLMASTVGATSVAAEGPAISKVSGKLRQGSSIRISGSDFGSGPNLLVFDDFEAGKKGRPIATGPGSARLGGWDATVGRVTYDDTYAVSGNMALRADMRTHYENWVGIQFPGKTREVFSCWWVRIPRVMPGEGHPLHLNWKHVWVNGKTPWDDDVWVMFSEDDIASLVVEGNCGPIPTSTGWNLKSRFSRGDWLRMSWYLKGDLTDGRYELEVMTEKGFRQSFSAHGRTWGGNWGNDGVNQPMQYETIRFNQFGRKTANSYPAFDDCYVATGAHCRARVVIGDQAKYAECKTLAILGVARWRKRSVAAIVNLGNLDARSGLYLFVIDATGKPSEGFPIGPRKRIPKQTRPPVPTSRSSTTKPSLPQQPH